MKILAIDPGMSGAVVLFGAGVFEVRRDFKHFEDIPRAVGDLAVRADVAILELVASRPGQGVSSMFTFGFSAGIAMGALQQAGFSIFDRKKKPLLEVSPQKWQNFFWDIMGVEKPNRKHFNSREVVMRFVPSAAVYLKRKMDHNTADAILIAVWYLMASPAIGSLREKDRHNLEWLLRRFNVQKEKD